MMVEDSLKLTNGFTVDIIRRTDAQAVTPVAVGENGDQQFDTILITADRDATDLVQIDPASVFIAGLQLHEQHVFRGLSIDG